MPQENTLGQGIQDDRQHSEHEQWIKNLEEKGRRMRAVRNAAIALANKHPDKFVVSPNTNEYLSSLNAEAQFKVEFDDGTVELILRTGITYYKDGSREESYNIRPVDGNHWDDGAISYRLDVAHGESVDQDHERIKGIVEKNGDDNSFSDVLGAMADTSFEESEDGQYSRFSDTYAETTITTEAAEYLLCNATEVTTPETIDFTPVISLQMFREMVENRTQSSFGYFPTSSN